MMKTKIIALLILTFSALSISTYNLMAKGQSAEICGMEDINGQRIDLSNLCGSSSGSPAIRTNPNNFQVSIKRREAGIPVIDVLFNGRKSYEMLLDTGASGTVLTVRMAEDLGLTPEGYVMVQTPSSSATPFTVTTLDSLSVGNAVIRNLEVAVSPTLPIGLLGQDVFSRYDITIRKNIVEFQHRR
jgi:aspartyl protease family protein